MTSLCRVGSRFEYGLLTIDSWISLKYVTCVFVYSLEQYGIQIVTSECVLSRFVECIPNHDRVIMSL